VCSLTLTLTLALTLILTLTLTLTPNEVWSLEAGLRTSLAQADAAPGIGQKPLRFLEPSLEGDDQAHVAGMRLRLGVEGVFQAYMRLGRVLLRLALLSWCALVP